MSKQDNWEPIGDGVEATNPLPDDIVEKIDKVSPKNEKVKMYDGKSKKEIWNELNALKTDSSESIFSPEICSKISSAGLIVLTKLTTFMKNKKWLKQEIPFDKIEPETKQNLDEALSVNAKIYLKDKLNEKTAPSLMLGSALVAVTTDAMSKRKIDVEPEKQEIENNNVKVGTPIRIDDNKNSMPLV